MEKESKPSKTLDKAMMGDLRDAECGEFVKTKFAELFGGEWDFTESMNDSRDIINVLLYRYVVCFLLNVLWQTTHERIAPASFNTAYQKFIEIPTNSGITDELPPIDTPDLLINMMSAVSGKTPEELIKWISPSMRKIIPDGKALLSG